MIERDIIKTTLPKAKELKKIYRATNNHWQKRYSFKIEDMYLINLDLILLLQSFFTEVSVNSKDRKGGYTRIIKAGFRPGDKADMAYIELVDRKLEEELESAEPELKEEETAA